MQAHIITLANQKGGVGKTTTTLALAGGLTQRGYKVLVLDMDGQLNTSKTLKADIEAFTILEVITGQVSIEKAVQHIDGVDVIPGSTSIDTMTSYATNSAAEMFILRDILEDVKERYDFILIDTHPDIQPPTLNALTASTEVIIPTEASQYGVDAIRQVLEAIGVIQKYTNTSLVSLGALLTMYNTRTNLAKNLRKKTGEIMQNNGGVFETVIRNDVKIGEAQQEDVRKNIFTYAPKGHASEDYNNFIDEVLEKINMPATKEA